MLPFLILILMALPSLVWSAPVTLIVADEFPAMQVLTNALNQSENITGHIVSQKEMPARLDSFSPVVVYIHGDLKESVEYALIDYTLSGGKLVVLHHSISSGKRKNKKWFSFLGIELPQGDVRQGGYKWIEPVTLSLFNLATNHFITTHQVPYQDGLVFNAAPQGAPTKSVPGFVLDQSEVYLNHQFTEPRTLLLGFKYVDAKSGEVFQQDRAGWLKTSGKGQIIYLMPGHSSRDFNDPVYSRIVLNAIISKP